VLGNLLMNAQVHGGTGVGVRLVAEATGADTVRILVADDGPGIPAADADRVFEAFVRLDDGAGRGHRTSGLGLTYCRAAITAMGGTIRLVPVPRGASFQLDLPVAPRFRAEPAA
jgi:signal transduction histidine kinase